MAKYPKLMWDGVDEGLFRDSLTPYTTKVNARRDFSFSLSEAGLMQAEHPVKNAGSNSNIEFDPALMPV